MIEQIRRAGPELAAICLRHNVRRLDVFGSAVGTDFDPTTSDLDFLVEFEPFPTGGYAGHYFGLIDDLKTLFGRPVDVLVARAVRNPYLLHSINLTRESIFAATPAAFDLWPFPQRGGVVTNELIDDLREVDFVQEDRRPLKHSARPNSECCSKW